MTEETKRDILRDYNDRNITLREIEEKYGIPRATCTRIAVEAGATPRRPNAYGKRQGQKSTVCPKCKRLITVKGARFCCFCGTDVRSEKDILIENIEKVLTFVTYLPAQMRDEARDTMRAAIKELKG